MNKFLNAQIIIKNYNLRKTYAIWIQINANEIEIIIIYILFLKFIKQN